MKRLYSVLGAALLVAVVLTAVLSQTSPGDETAEETLYRSSRNLHQWGTISSFHGLPSEKVRAITQTRDGFLWFGTDSGLAKFDGRRVQTNIYSNLSSVPILALDVDQDGTLWVGSEKGAYFARDGEFNQVQKTESYSINSISFSEDAAILTNEAGLVFQSVKQGDGYVAKLLSQEEIPIRSSESGGSDILLGSYKSGLLRIRDGRSEAVLTRPRPFFLNVIRRDPLGRIWIGAKSGNDKSGLFVSSKLPELKVLGQDMGTVNTIGFDSSGNTWVGTDERGLFHFEGEKFKRRYSFSSTSGSLRSDQILAVFVDREGVIWIGTDEGVNRFDPMSPRNERVSNNTQGNFVRAVAADKNGLLLAGTNRGLSSSLGDDGVWRNVLEDRTVYTIEPNGSGRWLIGTASGLLDYDISSGRNEDILTDRDVRAVASFKGKVYAAAFGVGLIEIGEESNRRILNSSVVSLYAEKNEKLWIGTSDGVLRTFDGKTVSSEIPVADLKGAAIWSVTGDSETGIWLSTNRGLYLLKDKNVQVLLRGQNIRQSVVIQEQAQGNSLWCATEKGLFGLMFDSNFGWVSSRADIEQGFASENIFSLAAPNENSLLVGTNRGIVRKDIRRTRPLITVNRILSQRLHQPSELATGIELEYPQNTLSVEVTALSSRTFPEEFQYSFLLYDVDKKLLQKRFTDKEEFLMDNLPPGKYSVEIRAFDRNLTSSEALTFTVSVAQAPFPFVATVLAVLLLIALAALFWAVFSQRKIFRTSSELAFANKELNNARLNLANEAERERHRIARDLHDQTLADLRHLLLMADDVPTEKAPVFRTEIEGISDEIRRICEDLSPSVLENIGFTAALEWELGNAVEQLPDEREIETVFKAEEHLDDQIKLGRAEQIQIYRIAQEILNNIVRHANPSKIELHIGTTPAGVLRLEIRDDGTGFKPGDAARRNGRGLTNIQARAQLIKAEINWKKLPKRGTSFVLTKEQ